MKNTPNDFDVFEVSGCYASKIMLPNRFILLKPQLSMNAYHIPEETCKSKIKRNMD